MTRQSTFLTALAGAAFAATTAQASPGFDFVCFRDGFEASIGLDISWENAYVTIGAEELMLPGSGDYQTGSFEFSGDTFAFRGFLPEGTLFRNNEVAAHCYQSRDSIKNMALYDTETNGRWSSYDAPGQGFQTVRSSPSMVGEKRASLPSATPVKILENTDEFLDGFFWFKIEYDGGKQGYMWGALLCTDADDPELRTTLRRCS